MVWVLMSPAADDNKSPKGSATLRACNDDFSFYTASTAPWLPDVTIAV